MTQHLGLIGYPIGHSLSPAIQTAAFAALGLDWDYRLLPCPNEAAARQLISEARAAGSGFVGLNATTPYKALAAGLADLPSPRVSLSGSANTLAFLHPAAGAGNSKVEKGAPSATGAGAAGATGAGAAGATGAAGVGADAGAGALIAAETTDGRAVVRVLEAGGVNFQGARVAVCGSGNVARSILLELQELPLSEVLVFSRNPEGFSMASSAAPPSPGAPLSSAAPPPIRACSYTQAEAELPGTQVLIDATTLGMQPGDPAVVSPQFLHSGLYVLDLVYAHGQTALVTAARAAGAQAEDGLGVLVEQAALALEFWCAQQGLQLKAPRSAMRAAVC